MINSVLNSRLEAYIMYDFMIIIPGPLRSMLTKYIFTSIEAFS